MSVDFIVLHGNESILATRRMRTLVIAHSLFGAIADKLLEKCVAIGGQVCEDWLKMTALRCVVG